MNNKFFDMSLFKKINYWCDKPITLLIVSILFAIIDGFFGILAYKYGWLG